MKDRSVTLTAVPGERDLLAETLGASIKDAQTVTRTGQSTARSLEGVTRHRVPTHIDERGFVVELFNPSWGWSDAPLVYAYAFTVRPGRAKGWGLHERHEDRYFVLQGEAEVVLYDVRPESSTCGQISTYKLSEYDRGLVNIPRHVWHATRNLGAKDFVCVNFPTELYDHADPDKYRLPLDTPAIPYSFVGTPGW